MSDILFNAETSNRRVLPSLSAAFAARIDMDFIVGGKRVTLRETGRTPLKCPAKLAGASELADQWPPLVGLHADWGDGSTVITIGPDTSDDGENVALVVRCSDRDVYRLQIGWRFREPNPVTQGHLAGKLLRNTQAESAHAAVLCEQAGLSATKPRGCHFMLGHVLQSGELRPNAGQFLRNILLFSAICLGVAFKGEPSMGWTGSPLWTLPPRA